MYVPSQEWRRGSRRKAGPPPAGVWLDEATKVGKTGVHLEPPPERSASRLVDEHPPVGRTGVPAAVAAAAARSTYRRDVPQPTTAAEDEGEAPREPLPPREPSYSRWPAHKAPPAKAVALAPSPQRAEPRGRRKARRTRNVFASPVNRGCSPRTSPERHESLDGRPATDGGLPVRRARSAEMLPQWQTGNLWQPAPAASAIGTSPRSRATTPGALSPEPGAGLGESFSRTATPQPSPCVQQPARPADALPG